jgi:hypothetical protein
VVINDCVRSHPTPKEVGFLAHRDNQRKDSKKILALARILQYRYYGRKITFFLNHKNFNNNMEDVLITPPEKF